MLLPLCLWLAWSYRTLPRGAALNRHLACSAQVQVLFAVAVGVALVHFAAQETAVRLPVGQLVGGLFMITLVPVTAGLLLRGRGVIGEAGRQGLHRLATMAFFAIVIATFVDQWMVLAASITQVGPAALLLNGATMLTGGGLAMAMRASAPVRIALVMECGLQNAALGITLAVSMLAMPALAVPSVVYALLMNVTVLFIIGVQRLTPARASG
jgi:BASS family bile acid:Na+ symporter